MKGTGVTLDDTERRYPLPCPVCKTAMVSHHPDPDQPGLDRFECLRCGAVVIREGPPSDDMSG